MLGGTHICGCAWVHGLGHRSCGDLVNRHRGGRDGDDGIAVWIAAKDVLDGCVEGLVMIADMRALMLSRMDVLDGIGMDLVEGVELAAVCVINLTNPFAASVHPQTNGCWG